MSPLGFSATMYVLPSSCYITFHITILSNLQGSLSCMYYPIRSVFAIISFRSLVLVFILAARSVSGYTKNAYFLINSCYGNDELSSGGTFADLERGRLSPRDVFICLPKAKFRSYSLISAQLLNIIDIQKKYHDRHQDSKCHARDAKAQNCGRSTLGSITM